MAKILIVDDEPLARRRLKLLLDDIGGPAEVVGFADGVASALQQIVTLQPDILLLDIRMRDGTGFDLLANLPANAAPKIIFVTAFDDSAVRAFEANAIDYLLKPIKPERLKVALQKASENLDIGEIRRRLFEMQQLVEALRSHPPATQESEFETEFWIRRSGGDFVRLEAEAIDYASVEEDYVRLHSGDRSFLVRDSIRGVLKRLDPRLFVQIHRSCFVRVGAIREVVQSRVGPPSVMLHSGRRLEVGRVYGKALRARFRAGSPTQARS